MALLSAPGRSFELCVVAFFTARAYTLQEYWVHSCPYIHLIDRRPGITEDSISVALKFLVTSPALVVRSPLNTFTQSEARDELGKVGSEH